MNQLPPEVAKKYTCIVEPGPVHLRPPVGDHRIDLRTISLEEADQLFEKGFEFLKLNEEMLPADPNEQPEESGTVPDSVKKKLKKA